MANNILQQVVTYQMANLAFLQNYSAFIGTFNTKFNNFDKLVANLGDTVSFELPPRFTARNSLVVAFESAEQRVKTLTVNKAKSVAYDFTAQQFIFNVEDYMRRFGEGATAELGAEIEADVATNCLTAPYRFYGDGINQINSYTQLSSALAMFRNFGAANNSTRAYLSDVAVPAIIGNGLQQFAIDRNNEDANSWMVGDYDRCEFFRSNLLPVHIAGTEGQTQQTLTVVSVTKNADDAVVSITFSGTNANNDPDSVKLYDKFQFDDGVGGQPNLRFRTFVGHQVCSVPVQFKATANAGSTAGGEVTVNVYPPLKASSGKNQNINHEIAAGMQVTVLPSRRSGMIISGDAGYLAMPRLPDEDPFPTSAAYDPDTGVSMRMYYGSQFGQNSRGTVHDCIWGSTVAEDYAMELVFPL